MSMIPVVIASLLACLALGSQVTQFVDSSWLQTAPNTLLASGFEVSPNFELSLQVRFTETQTGAAGQPWPSLFQIAETSLSSGADVVPGGRLPAIYIPLGTTQLHISYTPEVSFEFHQFFNTPNLSVGDVHNILVRVDGAKFQVEVDGSLLSDIRLTHPVHSKRWSANVFAGNPWRAIPPTAEIRNVFYKPLFNPELLVGPDWYSPFTGALLDDEFLVSPEHEVDFDFRVNVTQIGTGWGSLFQFNDASDDSGVTGPLQGVWISRNADRLHVSSSDSQAPPYWSNDAPLDLTLGQEYHATMRTEGTQTLVWIDGQLQLNETRHTQARPLTAEVWAGSPVGYTNLGSEIRNLRYTALGVSRVPLSDPSVVVVLDTIADAGVTDCGWNTNPSWYPKGGVPKADLDTEQHCQSWSHENCLCFPSNLEVVQRRVFDLSRACPAGQTPQVLTGGGYWPYEFSSGMFSGHAIAGSVWQGAPQAGTANGQFASRTKSFKDVSQAFDVALAPGSSLVELDAVPPIATDPRALYFFYDVEVLCSANPLATITAWPRAVRLASCTETNRYSSGPSGFCDGEQRVNASALLHQGEGAVVAFEPDANRGSKQYMWTFDLDQTVMMSGIGMVGVHQSGFNSRSFSRKFSVGIGSQRYMKWQGVSAAGEFLSSTHGSGCQNSFPSESVTACSLDFSPISGATGIRYSTWSSCSGCIGTEVVDALTYTKVLAGQPDLDTASPAHFTQTTNNASHVSLDWHAVLTLGADLQQQYPPRWIQWEIAPEPAAIGAHGLVFSSGSNGASLSGTASWSSLSGHRFVVTATDGVARTSSVTVSLANSGCTNSLATNFCGSTCTRDDGTCVFDSAGLLAEIDSFKTTSVTKLSRWCSSRFNNGCAGFNQ